MPKCTKRPWIYVSKNQRPHIKINDNFHLTTPSESGGGQKLIGGISKKEDASLCSAAPDLYAACDFALKYLENIKREDDEDKAVINELKRALKKAID